MEDEVRFLARKLKSTESFGGSAVTSDEPRDNSGVTVYLTVFTAAVTGAITCVCY